MDSDAITVLAGEGDKADPFLIPLVSGVNVQTKNIRNLTRSRPSGTCAGSVLRQWAKETEREAEKERVLLCM